MGNKLCKKKGDFADGAAQMPNRQRSFKGIISKWNLKPKWKSDSHLNKQRLDVEEKNAKNKQHTSKNIINRPQSKSSDWTDVPLVAATDRDVDVVYVKNSQLSLIFNDNHTPTPPPRKHHKKPVGLREKIKAVAKQGLMAVQSSNSNNNQNNSNRKPVEEPLCVKKIINYCCPHCEAVSATCHRHRAQEASQNAAKAKQTYAPNSNQTNSKSIWDRKASSTSTSSLPTHNGVGILSIAIDDLEDIDGVAGSSLHSLPGDNNNKQLVNPLQQNTSTPIHDNNYKIMSRARSFGSLLPQILLHKLSANPSGAHTPSGGNQSGKAPLAEIESDDSFGGLEEWDVGLIEHYNPKDASLPRGVKGVVGAREHSWAVKGGNGWRDSLISNEDDILASLEGMIISDVEEKPAPPQRKSESLLKKITRENSNRPTTNTLEQNLNRSISATPPPSPEQIINDPFTINNNNQSADHSKLMKIIEDYKHKEDKSTEKTIDLYRNLSTEEALTKSISKTTSNVDTISQCDVTRKTYTIADDLSKFDSPNVNEFTRSAVVSTDVVGVDNNNVAVMHNDFLNAERRFVTETDSNLNKYGEMLKI